MHFAIIAAGEGSRLQEEGISQPKPLVPIAGEPMIDRLLAIMSRCGAESISVICRSTMTAVAQHLSQYAASHPATPIRLVKGETPSSMHSFALLTEVIPEGKVCVTTVDTIFREADFSAYVDAFSRQSEGGLFVVTPFVDDEKPLWVRPQPATLSERGFCIEQFYDREADMPAGEQRFVSGGIYGLDTRTAWPVLHRCLAQGQSRMRNYQRALIAAGIPLNAYIMEQVMDIDHASDIRKAEAWLAPVGAPGPAGMKNNEATEELARPLLFVERAAEHSPNSVERDAAVASAVVAQLQHQGLTVELMSEETFARQTVAELDRRFAGVIHMARRMPTLTRLARLSVPVINAPQNVATVAHSRELTLSLLQAADVAVPEWWAYDPEEDEMFQCEPHLQQLLPGWVKAMRPDGARPDDVAWVDSPLEADSRIITLASEQVPDIVVMRHVEGDLLKVYCVISADGPALWTFYPQEQHYSKFGEAERHNSPLSHTPLSEARLRLLAQTIAQVLGLEVFGFDAIVRPDGLPVVIDVNDWPSFSACRAEAAIAIARHIINTLTPK